MSRQQELERAWNAVATSGVPNGGMCWTVDFPTGRMVCDLQLLNLLACTFERLAWETPALANADAEKLDQIAANLATRLNYLLEPIRPIESDREGCVVQMRSNPPRQGDDGTSYYELLVRRSGLSLTRYRKSAGQPRQVIPAQVTSEVFVRLIGDLEDGGRL